MNIISSTILKLANRIIPNTVVRAASEWRRNRVFDKGFRELRMRLEAGQGVDTELLGRLIWGWSNNWSADSDYLGACLVEADRTTGNILECGSGLTTLAVGAAAIKEDRRLFALEHEPIWAERVNREVRRLGLDNVTVIEVPLSKKGTYDWYDVGQQLELDNIGFVICDGPPGTTRGGRYGLFPEMSDRFLAGCVILLDDAERETEKEAVSRWIDGWDVDHEFIGDTHVRARLVKRSSRD